MGYVKCPRCDLNYMLDHEEYCDVCKAELGLDSSINLDILIEDDEFNEDEVICPICKINPIEDGEECCSTCMEEKLDEESENDQEDTEDIVDNDVLFAAYDEDEVDVDQNKNDLIADLDYDSEESDELSDIDNEDDKL